MSPLTLLRLVKRNPDLADVVACHIIRARLPNWENVAHARSEVEHLITHSDHERSGWAQFIECELKSMISKMPNPRDAN